jgi:molybdopterin converting factor small subunit
MYSYLVNTNGYEQRVKFFADTREEADRKASEWVGENGSVIELVGFWSVSN